MKRREFMRSSGATLAALALERSGIAQAIERNTSGRSVFLMNRNWRFSAQRTPGDIGRDFDDSHFDQVTIPHTNKRLPWHGFDEKAYQFISIYRRHFRLPPEARDHLVFVDFDGAMTASKVWLNGQLLGEYKGGYTPFSFELTPHLNWAGENVLAVELDSTERPDIPPFGGEIDYLTFGGIYRDVRLRVVPKVFIENVFGRPADVLDANRRVEVRVFLDESQATNRALKLTAELRDGSRVIATNSSEFTPNRQPHYDLTLSNLRAIELWDI